MAYPNDILLPDDYLGYGFIDSKYGYNPHWDITWSFTYLLSGNEHGFSTFLTNYRELSSNIENSKPGQFLCYYDEYNNANGLLAIAFDTTGKFALPIGGHPGVNNSDVKPNSLIIRDSSDNIIFYSTLSSLGYSHILNYPDYQTLRFRFSNSGTKLSIDHKFELSTDFTTLTSIAINFNIEDYTRIYPGFTFCDPISSESIDYSTFILKNFHTQGNTSGPTYETLPYVPLSGSSEKQYTIVSGVTALPTTPIIRK